MPAQKRPFVLDKVVQLWVLLPRDIHDEENAALAGYTAPDLPSIMGVTIQRCQFCLSPRKKVPQVNEKFCSKCRAARRKAARTAFRFNEYPPQRVGKFLLPLPRPAT